MTQVGAVLTSLHLDDMDLDNLNSLVYFLRRLKKNNQTDQVRLSRNQLWLLSDNVLRCMQEGSRPMQVIDLYLGMIQLGVRNQKWQQLFLQTVGSHDLSSDMVKYICQCLHETGKHLNVIDLQVIQQVTPALDRYITTWGVEEVSEVLSYASTVQKQKKKWYAQCDILCQ